MDHRDEFHVVKMCQIFGVSHSSYYAWLKRPNSSQKNRKERLIKIATRMTKRISNPSITTRFSPRNDCRRQSIHHSDRGSQYASHEYKNLKKKKFQVKSMSRKGNCYDNAVIESFHGVLKRMGVSEKYRTQEEAKSSIFEYIEVFYNRKRSHSALKYVSPIQFEKKSFMKSKKSTVA
jgi:putative transposase